MVCPACGEATSGESRFCSACGFEIKPGASSRQTGTGSPSGSGIDLNEVQESEESQPTAASIAPGVIVRDRYKIERLLGQGGMGSVYLATDTTMHRKIAIKFINPELWQRRAAYLRFIREANVCLDLTHNHIIRVYNLEEWQGQTFLTMEFLDGFSLRSLMYHLKKQGGSLDWSRCRGILRQMLEATEYAHSRGVVHRDLKPGNIMLAKEPNGAHRAVVMDFGLARRDEDEMDAKTRIGSSLGTPEYMAPEQALSAAQVDGRADLFSIGAIAYEMLTGRVPRGRLEAPSQLCENLPDGVDEWVFKALEHDADKRFQSAREMAVALKQVGKKRAQPISTMDLELAPVDSHADSRVSDSNLLESKIPTSRIPESQLPDSKSADSSVLEMGSALDDLVSVDEILQSASSDLFAGSSAPPRRPSRSYSFHIPPGVFKAAAAIAAVVFLGWGAVSLYGKLTEPRSSATVSAGITVPPVPATPVNNDPYVETTAELGLEMVWLPGGEFTMGNSANPEDLVKQYGISSASFEDEYPAGPVTLTGFWISKTEVTNAQYKKFIDLAEDPAVKTTGPFDVAGADTEDMKPVTHVNWQNAYAFCMWLSKQTGKVYRLPTEAQWEYACRAGSISQFFFGDLFGAMAEYGWSAENSGDALQVVAQKKPNPFGLYDTHGNVWEWCRDFYVANYHSTRKGPDPVNLKQSPDRVVRGGSFKMDAPFCRSSVRSRQSPETANDNIGFRVVCLTQVPASETTPPAWMTKNNQQVISQQKNATGTQQKSSGSGGGARARRNRAKNTAVQ